MNLDTQLSMIENAEQNRDTLRLMEQSAATLREIHGTMNEEHVDDVRENIEEQMAVATQISDTLCRPFAGTSMDDDELNAEMELLEQEMMDQQMLQAPSVPAVPVVPVAQPEHPGPVAQPAAPPPAPAKRREADQLAQLSAMMS
eukprot:gnl/Spiro4/15513_TR8361_c1_g2_i1.p2 gnl/Spiro4/15513_TR8361_c1_g2~~gnl/Spiro4/15513_TR8361_c1_g2_i1.p2  ORF type:complete len:144 (+),score=50.97 gnl/Spiro4/15513_TR8361_c1_g2_i1:379-810(+)